MFSVKQFPSSVTKKRTFSQCFGREHNLIVGNVYDQTFEGLYCKCNRQYPDESPDACSSAMVQCIVCEDWYHLEHLECGPQGVPDSDADFAEVICDLCMSGNAKILAGYHNTLGAFSHNAEDLKEEDECKEGR